MPGRRGRKGEDGKRKAENLNVGRKSEVQHGEGGGGGGGGGGGVHSS